MLADPGDCIGIWDMNAPTKPAPARAQKTSIRGHLDGASDYLGFVSDITMASGLIVIAAIVTGMPGWVGFQAGAVFAALILGIVVLQRQLHAAHRLSSADRVTLVRAAVAALCAGLLFHGDTATTLGWWLSALAGAALVLDGIDGWLARRTGTASAFGARFDMETDAFFILVLSGLVWQLDKVGPWVLAIGAMRYVFLACAVLLPALNAPLFPSKRRQTVCVIQVVALVVCLLPAVGAGWATVIAAGALAALIYSFAIDTIWLLTRPAR